ncbi:MAG: hypothetical protein K2K41_07900, partial [Ruminiclostridium sp.]|nr:hypothetical protein [Ruminiclostridium sp.]
VSQSEESAATKSVDILFRMKKLIQNNNYPTKKTLMLFEKIAESIKIREIPEDDSTVLLFDKEDYANCMRKYREIENDRPYIIENILADLAFMDDPNQGIWNNFFTLAIFYNILKLCIPAFLETGLNDRDLAVAVSYATKIVLNTHLADKGILMSFMNNNSSDLPHAAFLIN